MDREAPRETDNVSVTLDRSDEALKSLPRHQWDDYIWQVCNDFVTGAKRQQSPPARRDATSSGSSVR